MAQSNRKPSLRTARERAFVCWRKHFPVPEVLGASPPYPHPGEGKFLHQLQCAEEIVSFLSQGNRKPLLRTARERRSCGWGRPSPCRMFLGASSHRPIRERRYFSIKCNFYFLKIGGLCSARHGCGHFRTGRNRFCIYFP